MPSNRLWSRSINEILVFDITLNVRFKTECLDKASVVFWWILCYRDQIVCVEWL